MSTRFVLKGEEAMRKKIERIASRTTDKVKVALRIEAEHIMTRSKRDFVPVDLGTLRSSGHVKEPVRKGKGVTVQLVYGGGAEDYAVIQHENPHFHHTVGSWKYLEFPFNDAIPGMDRRLASRLEID